MLVHDAVKAARGGRSLTGCRKSVLGVVVAANSVRSRRSYDCGLPGCEADTELMKSDVSAVWEPYRMISGGHGDDFPCGSVTCPLPSLGVLRVGGGWPQSEESSVTGGLKKNVIYRSGVRIWCYRRIVSSLQGGTCSEKRTTSGVREYFARVTGIAGITLRLSISDAAVCGFVLRDVLVGIASEPEPCGSDGV